VATTSKNKIGSDRGFSLIELMIVILIIAILVVAAIPAIERNLQLYRLEMAVGLVSNRLVEARLSAIKRNRAAWVTVNGNSRNIEIWSRNDAGQPITLAAPISLPQNIVLNGVQTSTFTFTSLGRNQSNTNNTIALMLSNSNNCKALTVTVAGRITLTQCP
jgi:prepilin-type N-terminal cleavage/methylation domain-containing protein